MSGPKAAFLSRQWPGFIFFICAATAGRHFLLSPTNTATLMAMQRCPAAPHDAPARAAAVSAQLASGHDDEMIFGPRERLHALKIRGGGFVYVLPDRD